MSLERFLRNPQIQELLEENNLDSVYWEYDNLGGDVSELTKFFIRNNIDLLNYLTFIPESAYYNTNVENIEIPSNIKAIHINAFAECDSLKEVIIYDGLTAIEEFAFYDCENLISIRLPETLQSIGRFAFQDNYNLTRVHIPSKVSFISEYAFKGCNELIIQCEKGSYAQRYADENKIEYELI